MGMVTRTVKLIPVSYTLDGNYVSVSDGDNMLTDTDSNTFAQVMGTTSGYGSGISLNFDYTTIPEDAEVSSFIFKIRAHKDTASTLSQPVTLNVSPYGVAKSIDYTDTTYTLSTNYNTWQHYVGAVIKTNSIGLGMIVDIYGAELNVTYTEFEPDTHGIFNLILPRG